MEKLKISLIIPAYNEEKYIGSCLDHVIKNSKGKFFEIIVVDNGSSDRTAEIVKRYPSIKIITEPNKNPSYARNAGFRESKGEILAYLDADTWIPENWVDMIEEEFKKDPELVCLSGPVLFYDITTFKNALVKIYWSLAKPIYWATRYMVVGANFAIRRDVLEKMNGFDTSISFYGDDSDLARRAKTFGKVKFKNDFNVLSSGRRFKKQGLVNTGLTYALNLFNIIIWEKPLTREYEDVR